MMTLAGSQRRLAALIGVSHQKVGRWLTIGGTTPQGEPSRVKPPTDPATLGAIAAAFDIHRTVTREQARIDGVPWNPRAPAAVYRPLMPDGRPGDRIAIKHSHWMTDATRREILRAAYQSRKFFGVSVRSVIQIAAYNRGIKRLEAAGAIAGRSERQEIDRQIFRIQEQLAKGGAGPETGAVYTPTQPLNPRDGFQFGIIMQNINDRLRQRHEPATGTAGTRLADEILLQLDPRQNAVSIATREARAAESRRVRAIAAKARRAKGKAR